MQSVDELAKTLWDYHHLHQPLRRTDCILVLCSNDIRVAEYAATLWRDGWAPLLIFSGNVGELTKGMWNKPEAEVFAEVARKAGVPRKKMLTENKSTNTGENVLFTRSLLHKKGILPQTVIIVQKPYMERRAYAVVKKVWPEVDCITTSPPIPFEHYFNTQLPKKLVINIMVGDLQRIKLYPEKGFQIPQKIPLSVERAYQALIQKGFTKHLIP